MIAAWPYINQTLVTQMDPQGSGEQVPNLLGNSDGTDQGHEGVLDSSVSQSAEAADGHVYSEGSPGYHIRTQLADGRPSLIIDLGSVGHLCGDRWAKTVAQAAARTGQEPTYQKRSKPLSVSGVGHGPQSAPFDCTLSISFRRADSEAISSGTVTTPAVANSDLPGLLGLTYGAA